MEQWSKILIEYGFEPWSDGGMQGWYRRNIFVKDCLAGEIARYYADDYIITTHEDMLSVNWLKKHVQGQEDLVKQRFLLLNSTCSNLTTKAFWLGVRGWLEILQYRKGDQEKKFEDLVYLAELNDTAK